MPPRPSGPRTQVFDLGDVLVHQLLCGREIANKRRNPPEDGALWRVWEFASSMRNFVYLIVDTQTHEAFVFDGCWDVDGIFKYAADIGAKVTGAVYSHAHFDHAGGVIPSAQTGGIQLIVGGVKEFAQRGIPVFAGKKDAAAIVRQCQMQPERLQVTDDGDCFQVGSVVCTVVSTPGHTPGSVCLRVPPSGAPGGGDVGAQCTRVVAKDGVLLSGDTLFVQAVGRTDTPESSQDDLLRSLSMLAKGLPEGCIICPGHDYAPDPYTTIAKERVANQMVNMGLQAYAKPPSLPQCGLSCCSRGPRQTAADFVSPPELTVRGLMGGELQFDGVPMRATVADLRQAVFEHLTSPLFGADSRKRLESADQLRISEGSGAARDDRLLTQVSSAGGGLVVSGAAFPSETMRHPWFLSNSKAIITGLKNAPELNGQSALVSDWVADKGRYEVLITAAGVRDIKHVKPDNLQVAPVGQVQAQPVGFRGNLAAMAAAWEVDEEEEEVDEEVDEIWTVVHKQKVIVRAEPKLQSSILDSRRPGDRVQVCRRKGEWVQLHPSEGFSEAWLLTDGRAKGLGQLLVREDVPPPPQRPLREAGGYPSTSSSQRKVPDPPTAPVGRRGPVASASQHAKNLGAVQEELERVELEKAMAIEDEDYDLAAELKVKQRELEAKLKELENSAGSEEERAAQLETLQKELQTAKASKLAAVEAEDFLAAAACRRRQSELEAEIVRLAG